MFEKDPVKKSVVAQPFSFKAVKIGYSVSDPRMQGRNIPETFSTVKGWIINRLAVIQSKD